MIRVADYIMQRLSQEGVNHLFHVTGRGSLFLSDALAKHAGLNAVSLHHEQSCAYAALSYTEQSEAIGVCLVSTGCASTNAITGVLCAWQDGVPCIFISGQNVLKETSSYTGIALRTYGQQEADIVSMVSPITKFACMITKPTEIVEVLEHALHVARTGRKGPVWIDIPLDLQSALIDPKSISMPELSSYTPQTVPKEQAIEKVANELVTAKRPVVLIGRGVRSAGAESKLRTFIDRWQIPLTYTASAPDSYGSANQLSIGSVGAMACSRAGNFTIANADYVLVLGSRLTPLTTGNDFCKFAREARITVVDIDPVEHSKESIRIDHFVESDLKYFLDKLSQCEPKQTCADWVKKCKHWKGLFKGVEPDFRSKDEVDLYQLADQLSEILPPKSTIVTDSGLAEVILPSNMRFADGIKCIHPASQGAMGFALPAAIGAQHASDSLVLTVTGDGSIMMNIQELESISFQRLPVKIVVINNNVYSIIRRRQRDLFRKRTIGTDPDNGVSCPDFSKVAKCFGIKYFKIENLSQLKDGLLNMINHDGPMLCEVMGRLDQSYIEVGHARSVDKRFVRRPLEDQEPFLPRDLFLQEMVIEPIDQ